MNAKYIVLKRAPIPTGDPFSRPMEVFGARHVLPMDLSVQIKDMDKSEVSGTAHDPDVVAMAPAMPMKLIAPLSSTKREIVEVEQKKMAWGIQAVDAHTSRYTGKGVVVAVLDTGIDASHPAFKGLTVVQKDFTGEGDGDKNGHGTHCAGTICGQDVDGIRIGVAPGVKKLLVGKVLGERAGGSSDQICNAIQWAVENGAEVISMSLGMDFPGYREALQRHGRLPEEVATSQALEGYRKNVQLFASMAAHLEARSVLTHPVVIVAAAGNESNREVGEYWELSVSPPAVADGIISVGAIQNTSHGFKVAKFSNTGVNLSAPGVDVVSAEAGGGLVPFSGTSMATPHVAGVTALWIESLKQNGAFNRLSLVSRLVASAGTERFQAGFDPLDIGAGMVRCPQ
jgi:subtilisin family serine protease